MAAEMCDHTIPPSLKEKLHGWDQLGEPYKCATCMVRSHIAEIKEIQAGLKDRGGVFESKNQYKLDSKWMKHKDWVAKWRVAKIRFQQEFELLEEFKHENSELADEFGVYHALQIWELESEDCSTVPGYNYVSDKQKEVKRETETKVTIHRDLASSPEETQDLWTEDREWVIKPKRKSRRRRIIEEKPKFGSTLPSSPSSSSDHVCGPDEHGLQGTEDITTQLNKQVNIGNCNLFGAIAVIELKAMKELVIDNTLSPRPPSKLPTIKLNTLPSTPGRPPLRSALKGNCPSLTELTYKPRASFAETTTIFSHHTYTSASTESAPIEALHNQHTIAESARRINQFWRPSPLYRPSTWASQLDGSEKADTSYHKVSWPVRERRLEREIEMEMRNEDKNKPIYQSEIKDIMEEVREKDRVCFTRNDEFDDAWGDSWEAQRKEDVDEKEKEQVELTMFERLSCLEKGETSCAGEDAEEAAPRFASATKPVFRNLTALKTLTGRGFGVRRGAFTMTFEKQIIVPAVPTQQFLYNLDARKAYKALECGTPLYMPMQKGAEVRPADMITGRWRISGREFSIPVMRRNTRSASTQLILYPAARASLRRRYRRSTSARQDVVPHRTSSCSKSKELARPALPSGKELILHPAAKVLEAPKTPKWQVMHEPK